MIFPGMTEISINQSSENDLILEENVWVCIDNSFYKIFYYDDNVVLLFIFFIFFALKRDERWRGKWKSFII